MDSLEVPHPALDDELRLLANHQRRLILRHLARESSNQTSIETLVDHLVDHSSANHTTRREAIQTQLHHKDLPAMEQYGLIEHDSRSGDVRYHPDDHIETLLECLPDG